MKLKLKGGHDYEIDATQIRMWRTEFPRVDVDQELRNMRAWCEANPSKRKTQRGARRFIVSWLMRSADKQPRDKGTYAAAHKPFEKEAPKVITREGAEKGMAMLRGALKTKAPIR